MYQIHKKLCHRLYTFIASASSSSDECMNLVICEAFYGHDIVLILDLQFDEHFHIGYFLPD